MRRPSLDPGSWDEQLGGAALIYSGVLIIQDNSQTWSQVLEAPNTIAIVSPPPLASRLLRCSLSLACFSTRSLLSLRSQARESALRLSSMERSSRVCINS